MENLWIEKITDGTTGNVVFIIRNPNTNEILKSIPAYALKSIFLSWAPEDTPQPEVLVAWKENSTIHVGFPVDHPPYRISFFEIVRAEAWNK